MRWIGLTGSLGSGKSTVTGILRGLGWTVLDADELAHQALSPGEGPYHQVLHDFGHDLKMSDGGINRKKLSQLVFGKPDQLEKLEKIIHPYVRAKVAAERGRWHGIGGLKALFYDVPLLFEKKMKGDFDEVWVVNCSPSIQRQRLRDGRSWSDDEIDRRLRHQLPLAEKVRLADVVIQNDGSREELLKTVEAALLKRKLV